MTELNLAKTKVALSVLVAVLAAVVGGVGGAVTMAYSVGGERATLVQRVNDHERRLATIEAAIERNQSDHQEIKTQLGRIEGKLDIPRPH